MTHIFGGGLDQGDHEVVVERFRSAPDGEIRPLDDRQARGGRKPRTTMSRRAVQRLRPARDEIIIATSVSRDAGIQLYGEYAIWGHMLQR